MIILQVHFQFSIDIEFNKLYLPDLSETRHLNAYNKY